jgi:TPP-dependent pyruvate/acetoin dehydrogenase alpha subunit
MSLMNTQQRNINLLEKMLRIRCIEEELANRYKEQQMRCPMHLCIGQEAIAVGVCENLTASDKMYSNHRAHGHYLAKGGDARAMVAEIYGKETGCCGGRGGSMHLIDLSVGFMGATPIVGGTVPLAVGAAWASKLKNSNDIAVIFFGDGCFEEGVLHESMNFAALHKLPIMFVCENNEYSVYTHRRNRQPDREIYKIAEAHGLNAKNFDGNDILQIISETKEMVRLAREGHGPQFVEFDVYRWREHCGPDFDNHLGYREADEVLFGHNKCPINRLKNESNIDDLIIREIRSKISKEVSDIFKFANSSAVPSNNNNGKYLYAS